jgi:hypothetical protein
MSKLTVKKLAVLKMLGKTTWSSMDELANAAAVTRHDWVTDSIEKTYWDATYDLLEMGYAKRGLNALRDEYVVITPKGSEYLANLAPSEA